jgi:hypothetical protein
MAGHGSPPRLTLSTLHIEARASKQHIFDARASILIIIIETIRKIYAK